MSIGPNVIDRTGEKPCCPDLYLIAKRLAEGHVPSLPERIIRALAQLRKKLAR